MTTRQLLVAITLLMALGICSASVEGAEPVDQTNSAAARYRAAFSVGCSPPNGKRVVYVWHRVPVSEIESDRIFKWLAAPDFEGCLSEIARTRAGLYESLLNLGPESSREEIMRVMDSVTSAWAERGVYEAVEEVAVTNSRGPRTDALLKACADLQGAREAREHTDGK
jgi:hypothetical protein